MTMRGSGSRSRRVGLSPSRTVAVTQPTVALGLTMLAAQVMPWGALYAPLRRRLFPQLDGRGRPDHIALTFDDGPNAESTPLILEALDRLGLRATFFMLGTQVEREPRLAAEVVAAGHEAAVHGHTHKAHVVRTPWDVIDDVRRARDVVAEATGTAPMWFRPPYGAVSGGSILASCRLRLPMVLWSTWGQDWTPEATPESVMRHIDRRLDGGGTVLLHDSSHLSAPGSWRAALGALSLLADRCSSEGWETGPLCDHGMVNGPVRLPLQARVSGATVGASA